MKVHLAEAYPEVGVSFDLPNGLFKSLWKKLESAVLQQPIKGITTMFKGDDFTLGFVISATRKRDVLQVKGPTFFPRQKTVDFVIHIPYRNFTDFTDRAQYVLDSVSQGVASTIDQYGGNGARVKESITDLIEAVRADPVKFQ